MTVAWRMQAYSFYSTRVHIWNRSACDAQDMLFFYGDYAVEPESQCDLEIRFVAAPEQRILDRLLLDRTATYAEYRTSSQSHWSPWTARSTIMPPFLLPPLRGRYVLLHGAAVKHRDSRVVLILAEHYRGKTTLTLTLTHRRGYQYLTEDLIVCDRLTGLVCPLNKPAGVRHGTISVLPELKALMGPECPKRDYISAVTGPITVAKISDMIPDSHYSQPAGVGSIIFLEGSAQSDCRLHELSEAESFSRLANHRFISGCDVRDEMRALLHLARISRSYVCTYDVASRRSIQDACAEIEGCGK